MPRYRVAIVGGGPAGLSTALFLANADPSLAEQVIVLEKEAYPREKLCAGGIGARADRMLETIGVYVDVPSVYVDGISLHTQEGAIVRRRNRIGRVVRRVEFDHELARTARRRRVEVLDGARVTDVTLGTSGVNIGTTRGAFEADVLVGADGVGSVVRRAVGLPTGRWRAQVVELDTEAAPDDPPRDLLHFDVFDRSLAGYAWDFPTVVDGTALVCRGVYQLKRGSSDTDVGVLLDRHLARRGLASKDYKLKRFAERGFEPHHAYARPRVILVGEAAGICALTGEGIAQAIQYGAVAGRYLAQKLAEGDLTFGDWGRSLARTKVGFDLRARTWLMPHYYGRGRALLERHLLMRPDFLGLGVDYFAGVRVSRRALARSMASAAWHAVRSRV